MHNVEATGQFVVNLALEGLFEQVNDTGTDFPHGVSEFEAAGVGSEPSLRVKPPRVAAPPVALECEVHSTLGIGNSTIVFGCVVHAVESQDVLVDEHPEISRLQPLSRLGKDEWGTVGGVRELLVFGMRTGGDRRGAMLSTCGSGLGWHAKGVPSRVID